MRSHEIFREYIWLVNTIWQAGKITFEEITNRWERSSIGNGAPLPRSTFNRHRDAIAEIFGITINCDRKFGNVYYIENADELNSPSIANWMASMLSVNNIVSESRAIQDRIILEHVYAGGQFLQPIIEAMKGNRIVSLTYTSYGKPSRDYIIEPYCIRLFRQRWYLLGRLTDRDKDDTFRIFAFDRISQLTVDNSRFKMKKDFDCNDYFSDFFGMMTDHRVKPEKVEIRAHGQERFYLKDLPLHHSQKEIARTDKTVDFELYLRPTTDFIATIFSKAGWIEVLSPQWLKDEVLSWSRKMLERIDGESDTLPQWK